MEHSRDSGDYRLYAAPHSLYSGKARAYLRFKGIPFTEITASLNTYRKVIIPRTGVRYLPVVITPDDVALQDTTDIIDALEERFPSCSVYPETPGQRLAALLLEAYGDEWLLLPAMYYRWHFGGDNRKFVLAEFGRMVMPGWPGFIQRYMGKKISARFKGALPKLGITERTYAAVEHGYETFLDQLNAHFKDVPFLLGDRPCIGDFGLMGPLYAHLYRDPHPGRLMASRAPEVARWVERMNDPRVNSGAFLPDDTVPETLMPILSHMFAEFVPVLQDTARALETWLQEHPETSIPRFIGTHRVRIGDVDEERVILPYSQWMWQRPHGYYHEQIGGARQVLDELLHKLDGFEAMQQPIPCPIERVNNRLVPVKKK